MSKELTPLEALAIVIYNLSEDGTSDLPNALKTIETALKALEIIKDIITIDSRDIGDNRVCVIIDGVSKIQKEEFDFLKEVFGK